MRFRKPHRRCRPKPRPLEISLDAHLWILQRVPHGRGGRRRRGRLLGCRFDAIWATYGAFRDDLNAAVAEAQAVADQHPANASYAGRRSEGFLLMVAIVVVATRLPRVKAVAVVVVLALYSTGLLDLVLTLVA